MRFVCAWMSFTAAMARAAEDRPIDGISDNSFLIEEAYNQETGVVQHIFTALHFQNSGERGWTFNFTQEWPASSERHQLSYSIPSMVFREGGEHHEGVGDVLLNYRFQALHEGELLPAFAPRFSLILPSGSRTRGTGNGVVGYQWSLPFSKRVSSRFAAHANFGLTYLPKVQAPTAGSGDRLSPKRSLLSPNVGASAIFALSSRLHALVEWTGNFEETLDEHGRRDRAFKAVLSPGIRAALVNKEGLQVVWGVGAPIGVTRSADDHDFLLYLSVEHRFL
jgi:hypothetical protein